MHRSSHRFPLPFVRVLALAALMSAAHPTAARGQTPQRATVYLDDGSVVTGTVAEYLPGDHITLVLLGGQQVVLAEAQISRVDLAASTPPSAATAPPASRTVGAPTPSPRVDRERPASAESPDPELLSRRIKLNAFGALRALGRWENDAGVTGSMQTGYGFGLRLEIPLGRFISIGPQFQLLSLADDGTDDSYIGVSPGLWVKPRYVIERANLELYAGLYVGFSALRYVARTDLGWHVGVAAGVQYFINRVLGVLVEVGAVRDSATVEGSGDEGGGAFGYTQVQLQVNVGFAFAF